MSVFKNFTQIDIASASTEFQCLQECPEDISETNQKEPGRTFSEFNEGSCGEPQMAQHLVVDFTHNNLDSEFVQKKCCAFWELIKSHPEIQNLMVIPEAGMYATPSSTDIATEDVFTEKTEEEPTIKEHTAVSMLDIVSKKGFIDKSFVAKIPQTFCPLGSTEYLENEAIKKPKAAQKKTKDPGLCHCPRERECCSKPKAEDIAPRSSKTVRAMCENMDKWDQQHPKCRPVCKSRRRVWNGKVQNTSAELLLDRKPKPDCFRRCPTKVYPNGPCPLFGRTRHVIINERDAVPPPPTVVRVCQAPIDDHVDTPYLRYMDMAKQNGAWNMVQECCAFCACHECCDCSSESYQLHDAERAASRRADMRQFDARVRQDYQLMRIMYDKP